MFALVDHAGCSSLLVQLNRAPSLQWISLFDDSKEAKAIDVAPILIDLGRSHDPSPRAKHMLSWLHTACETSNALLLIRSTWTHDRLARALKHRLDALLPEDLPVLLRFFDTRVFGSLMHVFDAHQKAAFCGVASRWWWLDRHGRLGDMVTREHTEDPLLGAIRFTDMQQARLIDKCEADTVAQEVVRAAPDLCSHLSRGRLHELVAACLPAARRHGIEGLPMQSLFCMAALDHGIGFHEQTPWLDALRTAHAWGHDFAWVVHQVENAR